jgi:outer membrane protein assembly factor BamB
MPEAPINALACPSCGAALKLEGDQGTCDYCGMVVERPYAQRRGPAQPVAQPSQPHAPAGSRRWKGLVPIFLVFDLVVFVILIMLLSREQLNPVLDRIFGGAPVPTSIAPRFPTVARLAAAAPRDATRDDLLAYTVGGNDGSAALRQLALIDTISGTLRWQSQPLTDQGSASHAVAAADTIYLIDKERLLALRAGDGSLAWQTSLVAEPPSGCPSCLQVVGDRVIVLQKDGSLQGFDARSGALIWSIRLADLPRRLLLVGQRLAVFQRMGDQGSQGVQLIDPASGAIVQQILPACSAANKGSLLHYDVPVLFSAEGAEMYTIAGNNYPCLQRWDLASGRLIAETPLIEGSVASGWRTDAPPLLIDGTIVYAATQDAIYAVDAASGATRQLIEDKQAHFYPVAGRDGVLVLLSTPTWDTGRWTILGLDMQSGARRWQFAVQRQTPLGLGSGADWLWRLTSQGLTVVQLPSGGSGQIAADVLDLQTGVSAGPQLTPIDKQASLTSEPLLGDRLIWLNFGDRILALDAATGKLAYRVP